MALNNDDLQRMRDAIDKGWNFTMCHELDFIAAVSELVDLAMEGEASLAQQIYDCFDDAPDLQSVIDDLQKTADDDDEETMVKKIYSVIEKLEEINEKIGDQYEKAEALLL